MIFIFMKSCLYTKWPKFISNIILYYLIITATNAFKSILTCTGSSYKFLANVCFIQSPRGPHHAVRHMRTLGPEAGIYVIAPTVFCAMQLLILVWDTCFWHQNPNLFRQQQTYASSLLLNPTCVFGVLKHLFCTRQRPGGAAVWSN